MPVGKFFCILFFANILNLQHKGFHMKYLYNAILTVASITPLLHSAENQLIIEKYESRLVEGAYEDLPDLEFCGSLNKIEDNFFLKLDNTKDKNTLAIFDNLSLPLSQKEANNILLHNMDISRDCEQVLIGTLNQEPMSIAMQGYYTFDLEVHAALTDTSQQPLKLHLANRMLCSDQSNYTASTDDISFFFNARNPLHSSLEKAMNEKRSIYLNAKICHKNNLFHQIHCSVSSFTKFIENKPECTVVDSNVSEAKLFLVKAYGRSTLEKIILLLQAVQSIENGVPLHMKQSIQKKNTSDQIISDILQFLQDRGFDQP